MGLIGIIEPLSTVLSSAVIKYQQHREKNSWERRESNSGLLGEKQERYLCAMQPPPPSPRHLAYLRSKPKFWTRIIPSLSEFSGNLFQ